MLAVATVASIVTLLDFSLEEAVVHFGAVALSTNDVAGTRGLIRRSLTLDVIVGLAVFVAVTAFSGPIASAASVGRLASVLIACSRRSTHSSAPRTEPMARSCSWVGDPTYGPGHSPRRPPRACCSS